MQIVATKYQKPADPQVLQAYREDGVIVLKGFLTPQAVQAVRDEMARYTRDKAPTLGRTEVFYEADGKTVRNLWRLDAHDPWFAGVLEQVAQLPMMAELLNGQVVRVGLETFNKPARVGSAVPPHQDNAYFARKPGDMMTVWIAIDPVTKANGPVHYVRGSHKAGVLPHKPSGVVGNSMGLADSVDRTSPHIVAPLLEPGDCMIHHCETIHFSEPNTSDQSRLGLLAVLRGAHTVDDPSIKARYEEARAKMLAQMK